MLPGTSTSAGLIVRSPFIIALLLKRSPGVTADFERWVGHFRGVHATILNRLGLGQHTPTHHPLGCHDHRTFVESRLIPDSSDVDERAVVPLASAARSGRAATAPDSQENFVTKHIAVTPRR